MVISLITDQFFLNPRIMPGVLRIQYLTKNTVKLNFPQRCCVFPRLNCVKSVCIWSYSGQYFPTFRLNTERYAVSLIIKSECGKIRTR